MVSYCILNDLFVKIIVSLMVSYCMHNDLYHDYSNFFFLSKIALIINLKYWYHHCICIEEINLSGNDLQRNWMVFEHSYVLSSVCLFAYSNIKVVKVKLLLLL